MGSRHCGRFDNRPMRWDLFCRVIDNFGDVPAYPIYTVFGPAASVTVGVVC